MQEHELTSKAFAFCFDASLGYILTELCTFEESKSWASREHYTINIGVTYDVEFQVSSFYVFKKNFSKDLDSGKAT